MSTAFDANDMDLDLDPTLMDDQVDTAAYSDGQSQADASFQRISVLLAHEIPEATEQTRALFKSANWSAHCHRASSVEDLQECLQEQNWDLIVGYGDSSEFLPAVIIKLLAEAGSQARAIFLDQDYSATNALQITQCGFHDYLTLAEEERFLFSVSREVQSLHHEMLARNSASVLAEAEAKSQLLLDTTADAIGYIGDGMLIDANHVFIETLGYSSIEELELQPLMDLAAKDSQPAIRKIIKQIGNGESDLPAAEVNLLGANGESIPVCMEFSAASHDGEACTQVILRGAAVAQSSPTQVATPNASDLPSTATDASFDHSEPDNCPAATFQSLQGRGMMYFISLCNPAGFKKSLDIDGYANLLNKVEEKLVSLFPAGTETRRYAGENWIAAYPDTEEGSSHIGKELCEAIDRTIASCCEVDSGAYTAVGISKYGVAEVSARDALDKAFQVCASQVNKGGFKVFAPRIDNAQGSAALKSAMELDRLKIKYQPVIGLHNQSTQWYEAFVFMRNDAGVEQDASELLDSLGLEKDNVALDQWLVSEAIDTLSSLVYENPNISLSVPLTASAISDENFADWLLEAVQASGLPKDSISFNVSAVQAQSYEAKCKKLMIKLLENGFKTMIKGVSLEQLDVVKACKPDFAQLSKSLTENLNAEENNSKEALKSIISHAGDTGAVCIAIGVNTAADLAQLWQTGIPYVQGSYLQAPLPNMSYEFSDIA